MIARLILTIAGLTLLAGCAVDRGECLERHTWLQMTPMPIGKSIYMQSTPVTVCDRWEFPDGKPA